jgi:hypothetical protein
MVMMPPNTTFEGSANRNIGAHSVVHHRWASEIYCGVQ